MVISEQIVISCCGGASRVKTFLARVALLLFLCASVSASYAADCSNGSILFREDFGGNNVEDPVAKGSGIPECSGYTYDDNPVDYAKMGKYAIRKQAVTTHVEWYSDIIDHTYPTDKNRGYFMQVDASERPCEFYHTQIDKVCEGVELYVSLYGASSTKRQGDHNGTIRMIVEDASSGSEIDHYDVEMPNLQNGKWERYGFSFTVPAGCQSIVYRIVNNADPNVSVSGNDFCLDDIEIRACLPLPTITPKMGTTICLGGSETLTGDMDNTINLTLPLTFTWYKCDTPSYNMADWKVVHTGKTLGLYNITTADAGFYKVLVTGAGQTPDLNACSCLSEFYEVAVSDCGDYRPQPCPDGTLLFKEDFGGNSVSDPSVKKEAIPQCSYDFGEDPRDSDGIGRYSIRKVGVDHNQWYKNIYDHTYPDDSDRGYFMQVDASSVSGIFYQTEITGLCENSELYMSMWGMSSTTTGFWANAFLKLIVEDLNGNVLQSSNIEIENAKGFWEQFGLTYVVPSGQNSVIFKIINNSNTNNGNDFCLDDIEVRLCNPPISLASPDSLCPGSDVTLSADFVNDGTYAEPVTLTWYKCDTISYEPSDWTKVGSGTSLDFQNVTEADEGYYRVWASGNGAPQLISKCNSASDFAKISLKVCESCVDTTVELLDTIALGNAYTKNGFNIPSPILGENVDTLKLRTSKGCDSIIALNLYVYKNTSVTIRTEICQGISYQENGFDVSAAGTYTQQLKNSTGGDSLITLVLEVLPTYDDTIAQTISQGESFTFLGNTYDAAGLYTTRLQTILGCDSIVTLSLTVLSGSSDTIHASICSGASYQANGFDESAAGIYTQQLKNVSGADSLVTLVLEVLPTYDDTISQTIIQGGSYTFAGNTYDAAGLYTAHLQSVSGCDSIVTLHLTVLSGSSDTIHASICSGASYQANGFNESAAGTYTQQLKNVSGADSLVTLMLDLLPTYDDTISQTIIQGGSYIFAGNTYDAAGLYTVHLQTVSGCDSTVTLHLTVLSGSSDTIHASICSGTSYQANGFDESAAGTYTQQLKNVSGADSLVTLVLEVLPTYDDTISQTIIQGGSYTFAGNTYDVAGLYTAHLQTVSGCDSIVTLHLCVLNGSSDTIRASICSGVSYHANGFDESAAGTYTQQLTNSTGGDSIITLVLEVLPTYNDTISQTIIQGGSYTFAGNTYNAAGLYTAHLQTVSGCDSTVTLHLSVLNGSSDTIRASICHGASYQAYGFDESAAGTYTQQLKDVSGADSLVTLVLEVLPTYDDTIKDAFCAGETYSQYGFSVSAGGTYRNEGTSVYGCDSIVTLILEELPSYTMTVNDTICEGDSYDGNGFDIPDPEEGTTTHTLSFLPTYGCDSVVTLSLCRLPLRHTSKEFVIQEGEAALLGGETYVDEGKYHQFVRSNSSCEDIEVVVKYKESKEETDTFSFVEIIPSEILVRGGGQDNRWHVENIELYPQAVVSIYDRWGKKLFEINDYNDATGWDGTYLGYDMPSTDYWYLIDVHEIDRVYVGHFTLLRK